MGIGETPVTKEDSVSGAAQAAKPAPSVEYSKEHLGEEPIKTVTDGKTKVIYNANDDVSAGARQAYYNQKGNWPPCINTSCKSYGRSHPNCLCYGSGSSEIGWQKLAHGGQVCNGPHKEDCEHYADGAQVEENTLFHNDPRHILDHASVHNGLLGTLTKLGHSKSEDKRKHIDDYLGAYRKGSKHLHSHLENIFVPHTQEPDKKSRMSLSDHLNDLNEHPEKLLDVGGNLGDQAPQHAAQLGAMAGTATQYLNSLRPGVKNDRTPKAVFDAKMPVDKHEESAYHRQLDLAQNPMLIISHAKNGTIIPTDIQTIATIYPRLFNNIKTKLGEQVISAKTKGLEVPAKQKFGLSMLLGMPLESVMTPEFMQAIIKAQGHQQMQQQQRMPPKNKKATGVELKQINKTNDLYSTDLQDRQKDKLTKD